MWRPITCGAALLAGTALSAYAARLRAPGEDLIQVVSPPSRGSASAHPDVNVIVSFGTAKDGTPADPSTFRARFRGKNVDVEPILIDGVQTGARATLPAALLRPGRALRNRLRLSVQGTRTPGSKGPRARDVDRVRFGVAETANTPPEAALAADTDAASLGVPVAFDATGSKDADLDALAFDWQFSDGETATGATVSHAFATSDGATVSATVHVSDGQATADATRMLPVKIEPDPGRTPGRLRVEATTTLEFSVVAVGATATRSLTVSNVDETSTSQVKMHVSTSGAGAFQAGPATTIDLGPNESATVDVTFAPTAEGHADARVVLVASASNRGAVSFIAHGYGGAAAGDGPTLMAVPIFALGSDITRLAADGGAVTIDDTTGQCGPPGTFGTGDPCLVAGDCTTSGEVCNAAGAPLDVSELCSDGKSLFLLSEESYTDPRDDPDTELTGTLARLDVDAAGAVTGKEILYRTTEDTSHIACDGVAAAQGGAAYLAEFRNVAFTDACERDERDALVSVNKATGNARIVSGFSRIDAAAGVAECDLRDGVDRLVVAPDGVAKYAGFEVHGLWRIGPTPLALTPDVSDRFALHPDGSVVIVVARDRGVTGAIELYRMTDQLVEHGALPLASLTPCAAIEVPNNSVPDNVMRTVATSIVVGPSSVPGQDATALATFLTASQVSAIDVLPPLGGLRGTVAFALPSGTTTCSALGVVSLQARDLTR